MDVFSSQNYSKLFKILGINYFNKNTLRCTRYKNILQGYIWCYGLLPSCIAISADSLKQA
jgi:hypothetical protein